MCPSLRKYVFPFLLALLVGIATSLISPDPWRNIRVSVDGCEFFLNGDKTCLEISVVDDTLLFSTPSSSKVFINSLRVFPVEVKNGVSMYRVRILQRTKEMGFLLGFSLTLYSMVSKVSYVLTSLLIIFLSNILGILDARSSLSSFSSSIIFVFLAGSAFEIAMRKTKLDEYLALRLSKSFKGRIGTTTAVLVSASILSALMSNTSATYLMVPLVISLFPEPEFALISLVSATAVGGSLTLIGTPPNLIVSNFIEKMTGFEVSFSDWFGWGFPVWMFGMIFVLTVAYTLVKDVKRFNGESLRMDSEKFKTLIVIGTTVVLWILSKKIGLNSGVIALLSITMFLIMGIFENEDVRKLRWDLIILFVGGLTLGKGMVETGYIQYLVGNAPEVHGRFGIFMLLLSILSIGTLFSSHTSAAALIGPVMIPLGMSFSDYFGEDPKSFGVKLAILSVMVINTAMALPISTPPSSIVFSTGRVRLRNLFLYGVIFGIYMSVVLALYFV